MLCNTRGGGVRGQRDQGRSGLEAESRPCCRDLTKWDVFLQSCPFSQSGSIIQHVTKYLVNSVCLNFQETRPKGSGERQALTTVESWDIPLHVSQRGCAGPSFNVSYLHFPFFYSVLLDCTTKWFFQQRVNWTVFSREGHLKCQVFRDELITLCGTRVCGVNMCWSPPRPCEWSEKNLTSFLGLRCNHF